jgi:hypothetical protein
VDHSCYRCHAAVKDGAPFCKNCGAPQIRVEAASDEPPLPVPPPREDTRPTVGPEQQPPWVPPTPAIRPPGPSPIHWSRALPVALVAGGFAILVGLLPGGIIPGMVLGGFLCVLFYVRRFPTEQVTAGAGAKLGSVAGGLGFALTALINSVGGLTSAGSGQLREALLKAQQQYVQILQQFVNRNPSPQGQQMVDYFRSPDSLSVFFAMVLCSMLIFYLAFSTLGGVLAAVVVKRRRRLR